MNFIGGERRVWKGRERGKAKKMMKEDEWFRKEYKYKEIKEKINLLMVLDETFISINLIY